MSALLGCFGSEETLNGSNNQPTNLSRKEASKRFLKRFLDLKHHLGQIDYSPFDERLRLLLEQLRADTNIVLEVPVVVPCAVNVGESRHQREKEARARASADRPNKPKLRKQRSIDLVDVDNLGGVNIPPVTRFEKLCVLECDKKVGKVKKLIDKFEKKGKKLLIKVKENMMINKTREKVIDKRRSKMSTLRKENKAKSVKQVNAFLHDTMTKSSDEMHQQMDSMFDTSLMGFKLILGKSLNSTVTPSVKRPYVINHKTHGMGGCGGGGGGGGGHQQSSRKLTEACHFDLFKTPCNNPLMTPKFVRFNETNTLKPYGSTSTASTIAELASSVMASSNSIKSFKTANSTFEPNFTICSYLPNNNNNNNNSMWKTADSSKHAANMLDQTFNNYENYNNGKPKINTTVTIIKKNVYIKPKVKRASRPPPPPPPQIKITCTDDEEGPKDDHGDDITMSPPQSQAQQPLSKYKPIPSSQLTAAEAQQPAATNTTTTVHRSRSSHRRFSSCCSSSSNDYNNNTDDKKKKKKKKNDDDEENYSVDELQEDDETDDEDEPRKPIPKWAQNDMLIRSARRQAFAQLDYARLFRASANTRIQLEKVFPVVKSTFHVRSSSAEWTSPSVWRRERSSEN